MANLIRPEVVGDEAAGHLLELLRTSLASERALKVRLRVARELAAGAYQVFVNGDEIALVGGDRRGLIDAAHDVVRRYRSEGRFLPPPSDEFAVTPKLAYRIFWTWDHSTNWDISQLGQQESGAFNVYEKQPEAFLADYRRLLHFMSEQGVNGLVVYGLLRDGHGGLEAAQELCAVAKDYGVRLLAGIAANSYGGTYYEGRHPYNLATWLDEHPELEASFASMPGFHIDDYGRVPFLKSDLSRAANSALPENLAWTLESIDWLLQNLDLGGVNVEFGDYAGNDVLADMKRILPAVVDRIRSHSDDLWIVTDLGWDSILDPDLPARLEGLPRDCIYEFTFNRTYWQQLEAGLESSVVARLPMPTTILRGQIGTQWNRQRYSHIGQQFARMAQIAHVAGMAGAAMFSEVSSFSVPNEFNYLAFARFSSDPSLAWQHFVASELAPRLGGLELATAYLEILDGLESTNADFVNLRERARAANPDHASEAVSRRWLWLVFELEKRIWATSNA